MRRERPQNRADDNDECDAASDGGFLRGHVFSVCGGGDAIRELALGNDRKSNCLGMEPRPRRDKFFSISSLDVTFVNLDNQK